MGFGEHGSKGTSVGASGKFGGYTSISGEAKYNLKTKKPEFKLGLNIGI